MGDDKVLSVGFPSTGYNPNNYFSPEDKTRLEAHVNEADLSNLGVSRERWRGYIKSNC